MSPMNSHPPGAVASLTTEPPCQHFGGRYLTFALGREEFGLPILKVREIMGLIPITQLPCAPSHVKGIINLRGQVIAVVDLRHRFEMSPENNSETTCIIVTEVLSAGSAPTHVGIIVDRVSEVVTIDSTAVSAPPDLVASVDAQYIQAIGKVGDSIKILIDIDQVIKGTPLPSASELAA